ARAAMAARRPSHTAAPQGADEQRLLDRFVEAFTHDDASALVALMTDDVWVRMPPLPFEYVGRDAAHRFFSAVAPHLRSIARLEPIGANRQAGWGEYVRDLRTGSLHLAGILVIATERDRVCEVTHFDTAAAPSLGLPRVLT